MIPSTPIQIQVFDKFPTFEIFIEQLKPANLILIYSDINSIEESISEERVTLEDINKIYSSKDMFAGIEYLSRWLNYLQDFLNINNRLTKPYDVAVMIYKDHRHFYLTDLKLIFEKIMRAEYGPFYGSVDSQRLIVSFTSYNVERYKVYKKALHTIRHQIVNGEEQLKSNLKEVVWQELQDENMPKDQLWPEFEKRVNERFPKVMESEARRLLKELPNTKKRIG